MEDSFNLGRLVRNHQKKHKSKPSQFGSVTGGVLKRLETNLRNQRTSRLTVFDNIRNISKCESPVPVSNAQSKVEHRRQQLEKWKEQKEKQKKEAASQKKKPFVAGVAHAPLKFVPPPPVVKPKPSTSGRVTRSQTTRNSAKSKEPKESSSKLSSQSFAPKNASFRPPELKNPIQLPSLAPSKTKKDKKQNITFDPILPNVLQEIKQTRSKTIKQPVVETKPNRKVAERATKTKSAKPSPKKNKYVRAPLQSSSSSEMERSQEVSPILTTKSSRKSLPAPSSPIIVSKTPRKSMPREAKHYTPKNRVPKSESSSEEKLRSPKSMETVPMTPEQIVEEAKKISPCVTMSRGKANARKEMKKKLDEGLLDEDASDMDSVDHFRQQLASEIKRMTEMCETWDKISEQTVLPESVQEAVLSAVGQARLLMSQKLAQFASLVERCARPDPGQAIVTPADLHGFWDMVFMQVENVDMRFKKLEELRSHGWVEEKPVEVKKKVVKTNAKKAAKPAAAAGGPSRLREMIAAARKAKKEQVEETPATLAPEAVNGDSKTFEAGFFSVRSPIKSPAARSPATRTPGSKNSLLKAVLSSEAKKSAGKSSASFAMLRASVLGKNVEYEGIAPIPQTPITPVNLYATPGRSILKAANTNTDKKSTRKSIKVVLFDHSDIEIQNSSYNTPDSDINEIRPEETNPDSGISSMDLETVENKENSRRKSKLIRQNAEDRSPVRTRSRRKSVTEDVVTPRRSSRKKVLQESEENVEEKTPVRSSRRRKTQHAE